MGAELGGVFYALWNEVAWSHAKWKEYRSLFGTSAAEIEILNRTAPYFFRIVQDGLWEDTLLHLCRLTDPPATGKRQNLTVRRVPNLIQRDDLRVQVQALVGRAVASTEFARDWRNRRIAHLDLVLILDQPAQPLSAASRAHVESALAAIRSVMNAVEAGFGGAPVAYEHFISGYDGAEGLLYHLRQSIGVERQSRRDLGIEDDPEVD
jgi:hypothetical protein